MDALGKIYGREKTWLGHWDSFNLQKKNGFQPLYQPKDPMNLAGPAGRPRRKVILTSNALLATRQNSRSVDEGDVLTFKKPPKTLGYKL